MQFVWCVVAVVLLYQRGESILFTIAVIVAFTNLFSSQFMCALGACNTTDGRFLTRDPVTLIHRVTSILGLGLLFYASLTSP